MTAIFTISGKMLRFLVSKLSYSSELMATKPLPTNKSCLSTDLLQVSHLMMLKLQKSQKHPGFMKACWQKKEELDKENVIVPTSTKKGKCNI